MQAMQNKIELGLSKHGLLVGFEGNRFEGFRDVGLQST